MHTNNNNSFDSQQSWALRVSNYILQRRQQTKSAYSQPKLGSKALVADDCQQDDRESQQGNKQYNMAILFQVFFILLAKQLDEGHTVLTLTQTDDEIPISAPVISHIMTTEQSSIDLTSIKSVNLNKKTTAKIPQVEYQLVSLYSWQLTVLDFLTAPLIDFINPTDFEEMDRLYQDHCSSHIDSTNQANSLKNNQQLSTFKLISLLLSKKEHLWRQASVNSAIKTQLNEQLQLAIAFYTQLKTLTLSALCQKLEQHDLFSKLIIDTQQQNSLSKLKQNPIIFQTQNLHQNNQQKTIVTLWLHRTWQAEYNLASKIKQILNNRVEPLDIQLPDNLNTQQVNAIEVANNNAFSIITGGPGTGKTYTVAQLVMALQQAQDTICFNPENTDGAAGGIKFSTDSASLALAAPTGKAAQRMQESLQAALDAADVEMQLQEAKTIHRLLGIGRTGKPRYNADNPLGEDVIIVDEASMLGVELANYLVSAVKPGARLILLGDANQLAAVDAGAVLADLCRIPRLQPIHAKLTESRRFGADSGIGKLATQINQEQVDLNAMWQLIEHDDALHFENTGYNFDTNRKDKDSQDTTNSLSKKNKLEKICTYYQNFITETQKLLNKPIATSMPDTSVVKQQLTELINVFNQFRVLSAGHHGEWGDNYINNYLTLWHTNMLKLPIRQDAWYHGRPIMVLQNNYELGLFNGDIGICLLTAGEKGRLEVFFENKTQGIAVNLLNEALITTAYAMTIHKSQGSEFDHVAITLDNSHARLLSKELIYTAVTRAKKRVSIYSAKPAFEKAVQTATERNTGLGLQFS